MMDQREIAGNRLSVEGLNTRSATSEMTIGNTSHVGGNPFYMPTLNSG